MKTVRHALLLVLLGAAAVLAPPGEPAAAGGSWMQPARDRYAAGEQATVVGYTGGGALGWVEDGPFYAYLVLEPLPRPEGAPTLPGAPAPVPDGTEPARLPLGRMELQETGRPGWLAVRLAVTFTLPDDLAPGEYTVDYCNEACTTGIGDIVAGSVWVDVDPPGPVDRYWPADDPALRGEPAWVPLPPGPGPAEEPVPTTAVPTPTTASPAPASTAAERPAPATVPGRSASGSGPEATGRSGASASDSGLDPVAVALLGAGAVALLTIAVVLIRHRRAGAGRASDDRGRAAPTPDARVPVAGLR